MSKQPKNYAKTGQVPKGSSPTKRNVWWVGGITLLGLVAVLYFTYRSDFEKDNPKASAPVVSGETGQNTGKTAIDLLVGRWLRPDGGYILEIRGAGTDGKLDVGYFNPNPIKIGRADWVEKNGNLYVMVELQDVNYPGSTYGLEYMAGQDYLTGTYYQAVEKNTFEVTFVREK